MQSVRQIAVGLFVGSTALAIGCGSASTTDAHPSTADLAVAETTHVDDIEAPQKLVHSVTVETEHTVDFYEIPNGQTIVTETGLPYQRALLGNMVGAKSMAEVYKTLKPSSEVPATIVRADERAVASQATVHDESPPPAGSPAPVAGAGPKLYNAGEQTWFKNTFCQDTGTVSLVKCIQGFSYTHSLWQLGGSFNPVVMVGSEAAQAGTFTVIYWNNGNPQTQLNVLVQPGHWTSTAIRFNGSYLWYQGNLDNAGGNTQVSEAVKNCGENNERSCALSCGGGFACDTANTDECQIDGTADGTCYEI
jgi:hypothetical protein